jgi:tripartite ATP-independent transporter DctP family solute receptor
MKGWNTVLVLAAVLTLTTAGATWAGQPITMKVGIGHAPTHSFVKASERLKESVEKRSGGQLKVDIFPSSQLGGEREMQEMVSLGTLEMTVTGVAVIYEPLYALLEAPFLYRDRDHIKKVMASPIVAELGESLLKKGIRYVGFYENGFRNITNGKRAIQAPGDVRGLKIRTPENLAQIETFKALGAVATPMAFSELYSALAQGVVDGQENPLQNIWNGKFYEVQKHLAMTGHIYNSAYVVVSDAFWKKLSAGQRTLVAEAVTEASNSQLDLVANLDKQLLTDMKAKGLQVTTPDREAFRKATAPAYDVFYGKFGERAKKIIETIRGM